jgi:hypothetical protein
VGVSSEDTGCVAGRPREATVAAAGDMAASGGGGLRPRMPPLIPFACANHALLVGRRSICVTLMPSTSVSALFVGVRH